MLLRKLDCSDDPLFRIRQTRMRGAGQHKEEGGGSDCPVEHGMLPGSWSQGQFHSGEFSPGRLSRRLRRPRSWASKERASDACNARSGKAQAVRRLLQQGAVRAFGQRGQAKPGRFGQSSWACLVARRRPAGRSCATSCGEWPPEKFGCTIDLRSFPRCDRQIFTSLRSVGVCQHHLSSDRI